MNDQPLLSANQTHSSAIDTNRISETRAKLKESGQTSGDHAARETASRTGRYSKTLSKHSDRSYNNQALTENTTDNLVEDIDTNTVTHTHRGELIPLGRAATPNHGSSPIDN